ncbi:hypothetical protein ABIF86_007836 [Bradyrhizobium japonicum]
MRALIRDPQAIGSVTPLNVIGYLRSRGWTLYSDVRGRFSVWVHPNHPDEEILVPATRDARDYVAQLAEVLQELENAEGRSQLEILKDLQNSGFDIVRLAAQGPSTADGTVRIDAGVRLFEQARELLLSAACATVKPRPVFHSRKPAPALDYMSKARLGQTEQGSYVLTILSPVSPQLTFHSETDLFPSEPFERSVVKTLAGSVELAMGAAEAASTSADMSFLPFQASVGGGVSANLCEAILGLFGTVDASAIDLSIAWSLNRPAPADHTPSHLRLNSDFVPALREAARLFRAHDKLEGYLIEGPVVKLERFEGSDVGIVTIYARIEGIMRKVAVVFPSQSYNVAVWAHQTYRPVRVTGTVVKQGRSYMLLNPTELQPISDDEEEGEEERP